MFVRVFSEEEAPSIEVGGGEPGEKAMLIRAHVQVRQSNSQSSSMTKTGKGQDDAY